MFPRNKEIMVSPAIMFKEDGGFGSFYIVEEKIASFRKEVDISYLEDEEMVVLKVCSPTKRVKRATCSDFSSTYFYFYSSSLRI